MGWCVSLNLDFGCTLKPEIVQGQRRSAFTADLVVIWWLSLAATCCRMRGSGKARHVGYESGILVFLGIFPSCRLERMDNFTTREILHRHIPRRERNPKINTKYHLYCIVISYFNFNLLYSSCFAQAVHWDFHVSSSPTKAYSKPESPACRTAGRLHESCKMLRSMLDGHSDFRWFSFVYNTHPAIAIGCSSFQSNLERAVNTSILKTLRDINPLLTWEAARHLPQYVESPQP